MTGYRELKEKQHDVVESQQLAEIRDRTDTTLEQLRADVKTLAEVLLRRIPPPRLPLGRKAGG